MTRYFPVFLFWDTQNKYNIQQSTELPFRKDKYKIM